MKKVPGFTQFCELLRSPEVLLQNFTAAAILAVVKVVTAVSLGALVFSGPLSGYLSTGIGLFLIGNVVGGLLLASGSSFKAIVGGPRSGQAPIFATMALAIAATMEGQPEESIVATVVVSILVATIVTGLVLMLLGWARLGNMVRYIPYPVMGGFFAGLGYLLVAGGVSVTLGDIVAGEGWTQFFSFQVLSYLFPAIVFAVLLYVLNRRIKHWLLIPLFLAAGLATFYLVLHLTGTTIEAASSAGWLPQASPENAVFFPVIAPEHIALVDWGVIAGQAGTIAVMALMSMIILLLDTSGIELALNRDLDPNHELKVAGIGNLVGGFATSPVSLQSASDTVFTFGMGGTKFVMILMFAAMVIGVIVIGPAPIEFVPKAILGGLLIYVGIGFLIEWVWESRKKLPKTDYAVICGILLVVAVYGILEGVAAGTILAILLFVHNYSQLSVIKSEMSGFEHVSNIDRAQSKQRYLDKNGGQIHMFVLQGYLFFGTASRLLEDIQALLKKPTEAGIRYLILDFNHVDALDTSAVNSFSKLVQVCRKLDVVPVFTGGATSVSSRLRTLVNEWSQLESGPWFFSNLNEGVGWCEDQILLEIKDDSVEDDVQQLLSRILDNQSAAEIIADYFNPVNLAGGQAVFSQGEDGDSLYLILSGSISIALDLPDGKSLHLRTMRSGAILGEMALYTGAPRSATATVNEASKLLRLDLSGFDRLNQEHPKEAVYFHSFIVRLMSERLGRANREIMALSR